MTLIIDSGFNYDPDASAYIDAVEAADQADTPGIGAMETATRYAINDFVIGCKQDGIWDAIKASCILAGARTLAGALTTLKPAAAGGNIGPINVGDLFVQADYSRKTGLLGNGTTKYLDSNRNNNADPPTSQHLSAYVTEQPYSTSDPTYIYVGTIYNLAGSSVIGRSGFSGRRAFIQMRRGTSFVATGGTAVTGFFGASINSGSSYGVRYDKQSVTQNSTSAIPRDENINVFRNGSGSAYAANRIAFYSIGESLDLALLDARVTALINAFGVAIP